MAGGPFDYITPAAQTNPFASAIQGFGIGQQVVQKQQQSQLAQQQLKAQLDLQRQYQQDSVSLLNNPNAGARDFAAFQLKYPQFKEATKGAFDKLSDEQKKQQLGEAVKVSSALAAGRKDVALASIDQRIKAMENSGANPQEINAIKGVRQTLDILPDDQALNASLMYGSTIDPDFAKNFAGIRTEARAQQEQPLKTAKTGAEVANIESQIQTRGAELEIKRRETEIKALEARLKGEDNDLKRQELQGKIQDAQEKRDLLKRNQESDASAAFGTVDRVLDTVDRIKKHPGLSGAVGFRLGTAAIPGTDAADASALIEQLGSQGFLAEVDKMRGLGALTEAEGKKLTSAIGSLDKSQSEKQFTRNLEDIKSQFDAAKKRLETKFGVKAPEAAPVVVSKKYGNVTQKMVDTLAQQKGVSPEVARQFYEAN